MDIREQKTLASKASARAPRRGWKAPTVILSAAVLLQVLAKGAPNTVERYYSHGLYPYIGRGLSLINQLVPFSLAEAVFVSFVLGSVIAALWQLRVFYLKRVVLREFARSILIKLLWLTSGGLIIFLLIWGLNYYRQPLSETLDLEQREASSAELEEISRIIIAEVNRAYQQSHRTEEVKRQNLLSQSTIVELLVSAFDQQAALLGTQSAGFGPPKPIYFSHVLTQLGLTGIYIPFTGEPNFNTEPPDFDLPFTLAHEMAHQRGFAREDEANFIAFLVCINSSDAYLRYSGYIHSLSVLAPLARISPPLYRQLIATLDAGPRADLRARNKFWLDNLGKASKVSQRINDAYLKANGVKSGVRNYDDSVTLIVRYFLKRSSGSS